MKEIKGTFNYYSTHYHRGSHRTSDGFKYHYCDTTGVDGPFFNEILPITYQDIIVIRKFSKEINDKYYSCEEDYEWAESYTPNSSSNQGEDFGLCEFFNKCFSEKYDIHLIEGSLDECSISINDMPSLKCVEAASNTAKQFRADAASKLKQEILKLKQNLSELEESLRNIESDDTVLKKLLAELHDPISSNPLLFELNIPFYNRFYPLDIAIYNQDEKLLDTLISKGAYLYNSDFDPKISAKCGHLKKIHELIVNRTLSRKNVINVYKCISYLPETEFYGLFEPNQDLVRGERVLLTREDKTKILVAIKLYYRNRGYQSPLDRDPFKIVIEDLLKNKEFERVNYLYTESPFKYISKEDMLELSFKYGNTKYINHLSLWELVSEITDTFRYSHALGRLEYDSWGDVLRLKWNFEPHIKPENIGQELYDKIMDQIENHSSSYMF